MRSLGQFQTPLFKNFTTTKNVPKEYLRGKHLIHLFAFCAFARMSLCLFVLFVLLVLLVLLVCVKSFRKKNKEFKTALITSFILLLNFNYHNPFQSLKSFSIITIFFNYHGRFYHNLFYYCLFHHNLFQSLYNL